MDYFIYRVSFLEWGSMDSHYTYAAILAGSLSIPLIASFLKPLVFSKNWRAFGTSTFLVGAFFILWDILFTQWGVWGFNEAKHLSLKLMDLPLEEILFFFVVPFCCLFIFENVYVYVVKSRERLSTSTMWSLTCIGMGLFLIGIAHWGRLYTASTFMLAGGVLMGISMTRAHWLPAYLIAYLFSNIPFVLVNGLLTGSFGMKEVVWYNDAENLGLRLQEISGFSWTQVNIPLDDFVYSFALLLLNTAIYMYVKYQASSAA